MKRKWEKRENLKQEQSKKIKRNKKFATNMKITGAHNQNIFKILISFSSLKNVYNCSYCVICGDP
jgi:ERCC4-type nuclease